jgi:SAM-dependent methyltransferase
MEHILHHADANIIITSSNANQHTIKVNMVNDDVFIPIDTWQTSYPIDLIAKILQVKGPAYLCDEIMRDEWPGYVENAIRFDVFAYVNTKQLKNKKVLDFGCGSGASTMVLARMLPFTQFTGVELEEDLLEIARLRSVHYKMGDRIKFHLSPDGNSLPENIGSFDCVFLNAVYEHLLPNERKTVLQLLWKHLKPGGLMFINQTPYRWFPIESHTTSGLVFINYMPDLIASFYARRFSKRKLANNDWPTLLRQGIRGGSVGEICKLLKKDFHKPVVLNPSQLGLKDRIDIWYAVSSKSRYLFIKKTFFYIVKLIKISTGVIFLPTLALAIKKSKE